MLWPWFESKTNFPNNTVLCIYFGQMLKAKEPEPHKNLRHRKSGFNCSIFVKANNLIWNPDTRKMYSIIECCYLIKWFTLYHVYHLIRILLSTDNMISWGNIISWNQMLSDNMLPVDNMHACIYLVKCYQLVTWYLITRLPADNIM
jgi:hypothetical protein